MTGHRPGAFLPGLAAVSALPVLYAVWVRPRLLAWGATREEAAGSYPGDEIIPEPDSGATMAATLPSPPGGVWRWLVQMGGGRGGWYSWDWLDNDRKPSADRIVPEWQSLEEGQQLHRAPRGENWFTVVVLEPNRTLVLHSAYGMFSGRSFDPRSGAAPWAYIDGIWGFHLRPAPGDRTRLVVRSRSRSAPGPVARPFGWLVGEPVHFVLQARQFHNLRTRVSAGL